jgi:hypothetical protein
MSGIMARIERQCHDRRQPHREERVEKALSATARGAAVPGVAGYRG